MQIVPVLPTAGQIYRNTVFREIFGILSGILEIIYSFHDCSRKPGETLFYKTEEQQLHLLPFKVYCH
jgi:hypothetical protein